LRAALHPSESPDNGREGDDQTQVLQGTPVAVLVYGPALGGKSYTHRGSAGCPGLLPRAFSQLLAAAAADAQHRYAFRLRALELQHDKVRASAG